MESAAHLTAHARTPDNQNGTLLGLQAVTLSAQQDYTHRAGDTVSSNGTVAFSLSGAFTNWRTGCCPAIWRSLRPASPIRPSWWVKRCN